jgi:hypothetical protein
MNIIADKKYRELVRLLIPAGEHAMMNVSPWSLEKNRTFTCGCGYKHIIPENALTLMETKDKDGNSDYAVNVKIGSDLVCSQCGRPNYELLTFAHRYGLLRPAPKPRVRKGKGEPALPFTEFITVKTQ